MSVSSEPPAVDIADLVREFTVRKKPAIRALDGVSLSVPRGEVHGLLGPNGAGKTTLVKILSTVLLPTSGRAAICGHDVVEQSRAVRPLIGIVFGGERGLYTRLTARQNLEYWGALYRLPASEVKGRADSLLERVGLTERADQRVEEFSRGMKQRLHLARGLIGDAKVLFLDEPTTGMDPLAAREFRADRRAPRRGADDPARDPRHGRGRGALRPRDADRPRRDPRDRVAANARERDLAVPADRRRGCRRGR